jgi:hypothetical protein
VREEAGIVTFKNAEDLRATVRAAGATTDPIGYRPVRSA